MKKIIVLVSVLVFLSAGCAKVELKKEAPTSPPASYEQLPR